MDIDYTNQHAMKNKRNNSCIAVIVTLLCVSIDVFLFSVSADVRIFLILGMYFILYYRFHMKSQMTLGLAFVFVIISYVQFMLTDPNVFANPGAVPLSAERMAVWVYLFMLSGIVQQWREYFTEN